MSRNLLALPSPLLQKSLKLIQALDPANASHCTYPVLRAIVTHINNNKEKTAIDLLAVKLGWRNREKTKSLILEIKKIFEPYLLLLNYSKTIGIKRDLLLEEIEKQKNRINMLKDYRSDQDDLDLDLDFSENAIPYMEAYYNIDRLQSELRAM